MGHGAYGMFGGVEYRWHQIYDGTWVGVDPTEWDDAVHTQNDVLPPWSGYSIDAAGGNSTLEERDLVANICSAGNACLAVTQNAAYNIRTAASQFFTNLAQTQPKEAVLNFLSKPVVQRIVVSMSLLLSLPQASHNSKRTENMLISVQVEELTVQFQASLGDRSKRPYHLMVPEHSQTA
jgi:hypothetical protein